MTDTTMTQEIIKKANKTVTIKDDLGREIVLKKPKYSNFLNLIKALGSDLAKNDVYLQSISPLTSVVSIDGQTVPLNSQNEIEFLIKRLEESDNALTEILRVIAEEFSEYSTQQEYNEALKK